MEKEIKTRKAKVVTIKRKHLNPRLQEIIGTRFSGITSTTVIGDRRLRALNEVGLTMNTVALAGSLPKASNREMIPYTSAGIAIGASARTLIAKLIQKRHRQLVKEMKNVGLLQTKFEGSYPRDWINPAIVAKTHPVFYVKANGDLVFLKPTRTEFMRYQFQKKFLGKIGLNPWRWRAYIKKPKAPKKVWDIAKAKAIQLAETLRQPEPAFGFVRAETRSKTARKNYRRRR